MPSRCRDPVVSSYPCGRGQHRSQRNKTFVGAVLLHGAALLRLDLSAQPHRARPRNLGLAGELVRMRMWSRELFQLRPRQLEVSPTLAGDDTGPEGRIDDVVCRDTPLLRTPSYALCFICQAFDGPRSRSTS